MEVQYIQYASKPQSKDANGYERQWSILVVPIHAVDDDGDDEKLGSHGEGR